MSDHRSRLDKDGKATVRLDLGPRAEPNIPAHWTMRQRFAFRPTVDVKYKFDDPRHAFYQWVDTDGDGFFDARWFELVDATIPGEVFSLLPRDDTFRWFIAARAVDLSGLVNVNTAVDLRGGDTPISAVGDDDYRVGSTPADIDLRRMLGLQDTSRLYEFMPGEGGYAGLVSRPGPADYSGYDAAAALAVGNAAEDARLEYFDSHRLPLPGPLGILSALSAKDRFDRYREDAAGVFPGESMFDTLNVAEGTGCTRSCRCSGCRRFWSCSRTAARTTTRTPRRSSVCLLRGRTAQASTGTARCATIARCCSSVCTRSWRS
ncbi:MAG: hypothetical protein IID31_13375, partial [Planctomycetes bacterium]|nr:hypothetical protein [Planctomycetota bacterium]